MCVGCNFTAGALIDVINANICTDIAFYSCQAVLAVHLAVFPGAVSRFTVQSCSFVTTAGVAGDSLLFFGGLAENIKIDNCDFDTTWVGTSTGSPGRIVRFDANADAVDIRNNKIVVNGAQVVDHVTFEGVASTVSNVLIDGNNFSTFFRCIHFPDVGVTTMVAIRNNVIDGGIETHEQHGLLVGDGTHFMQIVGNDFNNIDGGLVLKRGITVDSTAGTWRGVITDNLFRIGTITTAASQSACIFIEAIAATALRAGIHNNILRSCSSNADAYGIYVRANGTNNSVHVTNNQFSNQIQSSGIAGTEVVGVLVRDMVGGTIANNSFVDGSISSTVDADAACIHVQNCVNMIVQGNDLATPAVSGAPTTYQAGIYCSGTLTNLSVIGNVLLGASLGTVEVGIHLDLGTSSLLNARIENNQITWGIDMDNGIAFESTGSVRGLSISGNQITGISGANVNTGIGLFCTSTTLMRGVQVNNNVIEESGFTIINYGIRILGAAASEMEAVQCNNNLIRGDLSGSGTRTGFALELFECIMIQVNNNLTDWCDAAIQGTSIEINNCQHGTVNSNTVRPGIVAVSADINISGTSDNMIIDGNIVGSALLGTGAVVVAGANQLIGADDTATAVTNKVS
jgi:hypothetical protein